MIGASWTSGQPRERQANVATSAASTTHTTSSATEGRFKGAFVAMSDDAVRVGRRVVEHVQQGTSHEGAHGITVAGGRERRDGQRCGGQWRERQRRRLI